MVASNALPVAWVVMTVPQTAPDPSADPGLLIDSS